MRDQSDNAFMAHRPQQRRGRREAADLVIAETVEIGATAELHRQSRKSRVPTGILQKGA
jgi:hypothetical protein